MKVGALEFDLIANIARLQKDLDQAKKLVSDTASHVEGVIGKMNNVFATLGVGLSAAGIVAFIKSGIDAADHLNKLSQRTGIATDSLSQLQYAAKLADVSNETLTTGIRKLNQAIAEGLSGDRQKIAMFKALGITTDDLGKGTQHVMFKMADAYSIARDGAGKVAFSTALMGKAGDEMIPLLNGGSAAIKDLMKEADRLGLTIGPEFAEKAEAWNDNMTRMSTGSQKLAILLATNVVEALGKAQQAFIDAGKEGSKFHAIITGLNVLFYGDDQHQNNVKQVESAEQILKLENAILTSRSKAAEASAAGNEREAAIHEKTAKRREKLLEAAKAEYEMHRRFGKVLGEEEDKAKAAAAAVKKAREEGTVLKVPNAESANAYDALLHKIQEHIDLAQLEIDATHKVTEEEKFALKIRSELDVLMKKYPGLSRAMVEAKLRESDATAQKNEKLKEEVKYARELAKFLETQDAELAAADKARTDERDRVNKSIADEGRTLKDANERLQLEHQLIGENDAARALSIGNLDIEIKRRNQIEEINRNLLLGEKERNAAIAAINSNSALERQMVTQRTAADDFERTWGGAFRNTEDALVEFVKTGKLSFSSLVSSILSGFARLAIQNNIVNPLYKWFFNSFGPGISLPSMSSSAFSPGGLASSGFGTGAAFGNLDFGGFFADGGFLEPGKWGIAGERGPEPIYGGRTGATVQPAGGGGDHFEFHVTNIVGSVATQGDLDRSMQVLEGRLMKKLARSRTHGGVMSE